jgi:hypothetical protein
MRAVTGFVVAETFASRESTSWRTRSMRVGASGADIDRNSSAAAGIGRKLSRPLDPPAAGAAWMAEVEMPGSPPLHSAEMLCLT